MKTKALHLGLISAGAIAGVLVSVGITALAQKETPAKLPLTELRRIRSQEPVVDEPVRDESGGAPDA